MKTVWGVCAFAIAAWLLGAGTATAEAGTIVTRPAADATLFAGGRVQAGQSFLVVGGDRSARAYLRWQIPASAFVERARLELYTPTGGRALRIHAGRATWSTRSLRRKTPRRLQLAGAVPGASARSWVKLDVTRFVRGGGSVSFVVSKAGGREARLTSSEGAAQFRPRLVLVLNRAPLCQDGERGGSEDTRLTGLLSCADDGALRYRPASSAANGTLEVAASGEFTYTPAANFHGADGFAFDACEAARPGRCARGRIQLRIDAVNDAPTAGAVSVTTAEDTPAQIPFSGSDVDGDSLTYSLASTPAHGAAAVSGNAATYTPAENRSGADSFAYLVSDGKGGTAGAPVSVTVTPVNDAPTANGQTATTPEDTAKSVVLEAADVEGDPLAFSIVSDPAHGQLAGTGAERTYTPDPGYHGPDSFTFTVSDGAADSNVATVVLSVSAINDAPLARDLAATTAEDTAKALALDGEDPDGDPLSYEVVVAPAHGTLSGSGAGRTYVPAANYHGPDSFSYKVSDGLADSNVATVTLTVDAVNDVPVAQDVAVTTAEDNAAAIALSATDVEGSALSFTIVTAPTHGTLSGTGANRTYAPQANYHGSDSFTFKVGDGAAESNVATATLTITAVNDAPVARNLAAATPEDTAKALVLDAADVDGDPLEFTIVSAPAHGALAGVGANRTYTPAANYNGSDSFTFRAGDGAAESNIATVTLTVSAVNDAPTAADQHASTPEDLPKALTLGASDVDGDVLSYAIVAGPAHGAVSGAGADRTYTPQQDYNGGDSFTFRVSDGSAVSNVAAVALTVTEVNDAPGPSPDTKSTAEDEALTFSAANLVVNDSKGPANESAQTLAVSGVSGALGGTVALAAGSITFTPQANFNGEATFAYTVTDDGQTGGVLDPRSATGTVTVTVDPVNDVPLAENDHYATPAGTALPVAAAEGVLKNDNDVDDRASLQAVLVSGPAQGTVALAADGSFSYQPTAGFNGRDSFLYRAHDGTASSERARVTIDVGNFTNNPPVAADRSVSAAEDAARSFTLPATDPDGDQLAYSIVAAPAHGTLTGTGADRTYTPEPHYNGPDSFTYKADDGTHESNIATVSVAVSEKNDPPTAVADEKTTAEDVALRFGASELLANDTAGPPNEASQALAVTAVGSPVGGSVELVAGEVAFTPAANFNGTASFSYTVADNGATAGSADPLSAAGSVSVVVTPVNDPPVAHDRSLTTEEDASGALTLSASDAEGDAVAFTILTPPAHGTLSGEGANRTYTPDPDYNGPDGFTYKAGDGAANSNLATVSLTVSEVNDPPTPSPDAKATDEDAAVRFPAAELLANDATGPPNEASQTLTVTQVGSPVGGAVELAGGEITFTPEADSNGAASFAYTIADDGQTEGAADPRSAEGTVTVAVAAVNDRPLAHLSSGTVNEDESATITLEATDVDGDALTYSIFIPPSNGSLTVPVGNQVTYTPVANYSGQDSFMFIASDGSSDSEVTLASVDVTPVNDAPVLDASGNPQLTPVNANASNPVGDTIADILAPGTGGDPVLSDVDGDSVGIAVTAVDEAGGAWQYKTADGAWSPLAGAADSAARLLDVDSRLRFVPTPGWSGDATVQFRAWDQTTGSLGGAADASVSGGSSPFSGALETATVTVIPNSLPIAIDDTVATEEDMPVSIPVLANDSDPDGEPLTITELTAPIDGTATIVGGEVRYVPTAHTNGNDQFTYTVRDPRGGTATGKVSLTIASVNDDPIARRDVEHVAENGVVVFDPTENDVGGPREESGQAVTITAITAPPTRGTAEIPPSGPDAGRIRYTPSTVPDAHPGSDTFDYKVCEQASPERCSVATVDMSVSRVTPTVETAPIPHGSAAGTDAADDIAIWVNPNDPAQSLVIGTNKFSDATTNGGLVVYDLTGAQVDYTNDGRTNNVDLRSDFALGGEQVTLVAASQRTDGTVSPPRPKRIAVYKLDAGTKTLIPVHSGLFSPGFEPLGACMYRSGKSGDLFVFIVAANGWVEQWRLSAASGGTGLVDASRVRSFRVNSPTTTSDVTEGCVADDETGSLYIAEEDVGIWKYSAEPDGGETRTQLDVVGAGHLTADVEGLAIAYGPAGAGYLIASSQGSSSYAVYRRDGNNTFVRSFKIKDGTLDGATITDGIDVTSAALGPAFPNGVFIAHDNNNAPDNQNFKLVPLEQIVQTAGLGSNGSCARPYADSSPWNVPIPTGAGVHPDSALHVAAVEGPLTSSPAQFTFPVYLVDENTPRETVTLSGFFSNVTNGGLTLTNQRAGTAVIPIPTGAVPAAGSDAQMIMIDPRTGDEWGFSNAQRDPVTGAWTGWNAYHYNVRWSGVPPYDASGRSFIPRGGGLPYLAGLVRPCELARGRIDHALAFAYDFPTAEFVYPASKSDGNSPGPPDMPEGSRLQLDPALTEADLAALGCTGHCLTIARALQVYGMYIIDNSRRPKVMLEYEGTAGWGGAVTSSTVSPIPLSAFRLLQPTAGPTLSAAPS